MQSYSKNSEEAEVIGLFFSDEPVGYEIIPFSRGDEDFREVIIAQWTSGEKRVIKLAENGFTSPERIKVWQRCAEEHRRLGYYCPEFICDKNGSFPVVDYKGHRCTVFAEEFSKYPTAEQLEKDKVEFQSWWDDAITMVARIAAEKLDFAEFPSGYCLFERFSETDKTDEVIEVALDWKKYADTLPVEFHEQVERIWKLWNDNRNALEPIYKTLPTSVFQADINNTNVLMDENGKFVGILDFNLCGKDVFLNYLFRECRIEVSCVQQTLKTVSAVYKFSDIEKQAAPLIFRCVEPIFYNALDDLKEAGEDKEKIKLCLDRAEHELTADFDFAAYMG